jgi:hypothetical protein
LDECNTLLGPVSTSMGLAVSLAGGSVMVEFDRHFYADSYVGSVLENRGP